MAERRSRRARGPRWLAVTLLAAGLAVVPAGPAGADGNEAPGASAAYRSITAGENHTCALTDSGFVKCWGDNEWGQLGMGDTADRGDGPGEMGDALGVSLGVGRTATAIAAGSNHTCALLDNQTVKCWGYNGHGRLGLGDTNTRGDGPNEMGSDLPTVPLAGTPIAITAGGYHTCALLQGGAVQCWGRNNQGQLGLGNTVDRGDNPNEMGANLPTVSLGAGRTATAVTAGIDFTCARLNGGAVKCWGNNAHGESGVGDTLDRGDAANEMGDALPFTSLGSGVTAAVVSAGGHHVCAVLNTGSLKCWGYNSTGELGVGATDSRGDAPNEMGTNLPAVSLGSGRTATGVSAGLAHTCAELDDHSVKCWGANTGRLGLGTVDTRGDAASEMGNALPAVSLGTGRTAAAVTTGDAHTCAKLDNGELKCWGANLSGQLGQGDTVPRGDNAGEMGDALPALVLVNDPRFTVVASADETSVAVGATIHLHLTITNTGNVALHQVAVTDANATGCQVAAFTLARGANRVVDCSHLAVAGDVPAFTNSASVDTDETAPVVSNTVTVGVAAAATLSEGSTLAVGIHHACAIVSGGSVRCWGRNDLGQLGLGDTVQRGDAPNEMGSNLPAVNLGTGRTARAISAEDNHTCALLDNGQVKCWGQNYSGQLGLGDTNHRGDQPGEMGDALPAVNLGSGRRATAIATGGYFSCALLDDATVKCWGSNSYGDLGLGDTNSRGDQSNEMGDNLAAVDLGSGRTVRSISAGSWLGVACAVLDDGSVKCWGHNAYGQLGLGDGNSRGDGPGEMGDDLPAIDLGTGVTAIGVEVGFVQTCALLADHSVKCWGYGGHGGLGSGDGAVHGDQPSDMGDNLVPVALGTGRTADAVNVGDNRACVRLENLTLKCWGFNWAGQTGTGDNVQRGDAPGEMGDALPVVNLGTGRTAAEVEAGFWTTCARLDDGAVKCWGDNQFGQLGQGDVSARGDQPGEMGDALPPIDFGAAPPPQASLSVLKTVDESSVVEGDTIHLHVKVTNTGKVTLHNVTITDANATGCQVAPFTLAVGANQTVDCTRVAAAGDIPTYTNTASVDTDETSPVASNQVSVAVGAASPSVTIVKSVDEVSVSPGQPIHYHLVVTNTGNVTLHGVDVTDTAAPDCGDDALLDLAAGAFEVVNCTHTPTGNDVGPFPNSASVDTVETTPLASNVVTVTVDPAVSIIKSATELSVVAGDTIHYQVRVTNNSAVTQSGLSVADPNASACAGALPDIAPGDDYTVNCTYTTTAANVGTYSNVATVDSSAIVAVTSNQVDVAVAPPPYRSVAAGNNHSCALRDPGSVKCWGANSNGELGQGNNIARRGDEAGEMGSNLVAAALGTGRSARAITAGAGHTCVLLDNASVKCWGLNSSGQLGLGDVASRGDGAGEMGDNLLAVDLGPGRSATAIVAGDSHTCALLDNATVKCWGGNSSGQLGLGDTANRGDGANEMGSNLPAVNLGTNRTAIAITAGQLHTCALLDNATVKCWGENANGQLGLGDVAKRGDGPGEMGDSLPAVSLGTGLTPVRVDAGGFQSCAVLNNGSVKCWGQNGNGQLGLGDTNRRGGNAGEMGDALPAVDLGTGRTVVFVDAGPASSCAILDNAALKCWGANTGRLGLGDTADRGDNAGEMGDALPAVSLGTGRTAMRVAVGATHGCALLDDAGYKCWGLNGFGQLGQGDATTRGNAPGQMGDSLPEIDLGSSTAAPAFTVVKNADESSVSPGESIHLHLTVNNTGNVVLHNVTITDANATSCQVAAFTLAVGASRTVDCAHVATVGDAPTYTNTASVDTDETAPVSSNQVSVAVLVANPSLTVVKSADETTVEAGATIHYHVLVTNTGNVVLHDVDVSDTNAPDCGDDSLFDLAVGASETVHCRYVTGAANVGSYPNTASVNTDETGALASNQVIVAVDPPPFRSITAGLSHACALTDRGTVKCWGVNSNGELGQGDAVTPRGDQAGEMGANLAFTALGASRSVRAIAAGDSHTCVVLDNGSVKCWGLNDRGQLGLGDTANRGDGPGEMGDNLPAVALGTGRTALDVTAGASHTCALLDDHTVKCWGDNATGQLGLGDTVRRGDGPTEMGDSLPVVDLGSGRSAVAISAGGNRSCALLDNASVKCWGNNNLGELGLGDTTDRGDGPNEMGDDLPAVNLGTGRTARSLSAGTGVTCVVLDGGSVKCWGINADGQLGLGDTARRGDQAGEMGDNLPTVDLGTSRTATGVSVGGGATGSTTGTVCAILDDASLKCWGTNGGRLGLGSTADRGDGPGEMGDGLPTVSLGTGRTAALVSAGGTHTCVMLDNRAYKCWGKNGSGQLGQGDTADRGDNGGEMGDGLPPIDLGSLPTGPAFTTRQTADEEVVVAGETVHLHLAITNTGTVVLHNVTITDANATSCQVVPFTLAVGASTTVDCTHVTSVGEVPQYTNAASVDTDETTPQSANSVDVEVDPVPGVISGSVTEAGGGTPLGGVWVAFLRTSDFSVAHLAVASGSGDYSGAVPPGSYYLYTVDPTGRHRAGFHGAPAIVNATQGNTIDVDPAMAALRGSIVGTITEDGTGSPVLGGWAVAASKATGAPLAGALVDGNGHFRIDGLRPGNDFVIYVDRTGAHVSEYYSDTHDANAAAPIVVTAAGTATANGSLASQSTTPGSAQLTGTVTEDGSGAPLGGVVVGALRASDYSFRKAELTDASGRYALNVPPGDYKMVFFDLTGDHNMEWYSNRPFDGLANAASVSAPNLTNVGLGLATGRLSGTVTHAVGGSPSAGAMVVAIDGNGGIAGGTLTAADGTFTVEGLIPGTYRATILDPNGGGTQEYWDNSPTYNGSTPFTITAGVTVTISAALTYP